MEYLRYKPVALWPLSDTAPFQDYSGYNRSGTLTGSESFGASVSAYTVSGHRFSNASYATFASPVYVAGKESAPFSLAVSVFPIRPSTATSAPQQVLSNMGNFDGIILEGTMVSFATEYVGQGQAKCSYDLQIYQKADIVAVHTATKNQLYVNGVLRAEVDITVAQQAATYDAADANLYMGDTTQSAGLLANMVAIYNRPLLAEEVARLYQFNNRRSESSVAKIYAGEEILVSTAARSAFLNTGWFTNADWSAAAMEGCTVENNQLVSMMTNELTTGGIWQDAIDLYVGETPMAIDSVNMFWYGQNVTVQASIDNSTWITVTKGVNLSIITTGFDPTGKDLFVRVLFDDGEEEAWIDSLQVRGYLTATATPPAGRPITYNNPVATMDEFTPAEFRDNWGVKLLGGTLVIGDEPVTNELPMNPLTVEVWVKQGSGTAMTRSFTPLASYVNGSAGSATPPVGEWALMHYTVAAPITGSITFGGDVQIGKVAVYPTALTASQVLSAYTHYIAVPTTTKDGSGAIQIAESTPAVVTYAYDWSVQQV